MANKVLSNNISEACATKRFEVYEDIEILEIRTSKSSENHGAYEFRLVWKPRAGLEACQ